MKYSTTTTFGRFNISHFGHANLIEKMLFRGQQAIVHVSDGSLNNSWDLRVLLLKVVCRRAGLDLSRIVFKKTKNPFNAVVDSISCSEFGETALVLGSDQVVMGIRISSDLDVPLILNDRKYSSTNIRYLIDSEDEETLSSCYNDKYAVRLAKLLRQEEINRERFSKIAKKTA